jgi:C4-dicarboxylate-specific signal transduction histidine kinase
MPSYSKRAISAWTAVFIAGIVLLSAMAATVSYLVHSEVKRMNMPDDDPEWIIFQIGFEHQRLLHAVETNKDDQEITLRGDIYLSRLFILRGARALGPVRESMLSDRLALLFASAEQTGMLLQQLGSPGGRTALLQQLRADSAFMNELMIQMSSLNRQIASERRAQYTWNLLYYLGALEVLLLVLLGMGMGLFSVTRKLREARDDLEKQYSTQAAILKSIDEVILGVGPDGKVLYSNPAAVALLGSSAAAGSVLGSAEASEGGLVSHICSLLSDPWQSDTGGSSATRKVELESDAGPRNYVIRKFLSDRYSLSGEEKIKEASFIVTVTDTTNQELAQRRRIDYDRRLSEVSQLLAYAAVSGGIVHEISQPLAAISNYVHSFQMALKAGRENEEVGALAEQLHVEVRRAMEVVRNVRRMGPQDNLEDGGTCDLSEAIEHSVRLVLLGRTPLPPVTLDQPQHRVVVSGSLPLIGQVIINLLKNALTASEEGGGRGAHISVTLLGDNATVAIEDFGAGVTEDAAKTLFAPFSKSSRGGMGLGLAICQRIAGTIGGSLSWENSPRGGAIFRFSVPLASEGVA